MATLRKVISLHHDMDAIVKGLIEEGRTREAYALRLLAVEFRRTTNGDAHIALGREQLDTLFAGAAIGPGELRAAAENYIPEFFKVVKPINTEVEATVPPIAVQRPQVSEDDPFADKTVAACFPNLSKALAKAGVKKQNDIAKVVAELDLTERAWTIKNAGAMASHYFAMRHPADPKKYPFDSDIGRHIEKIIRDALGEEGLDFARQPAADIVPPPDVVVPTQQDVRPAKNPIVAKGRANSLTPSSSSARVSRIPQVRNPYKNRKISDFYPCLGIALAHAGMAPAKKIAKYLTTHYDVPSRIAAGRIENYFDMAETRDPSRYPFNTSMGTIIETIILEKLGQAGIQLALSREGPVILNEVKVPEVAVEASSTKVPELASASPSVLAAAAAHEIVGHPTPTIDSEPAETFAPAAAAVAASPALPPRATPKAPLIVVGENFFIEHYRDRRISEADQTVDIALTIALKQGGIGSYAELLERRTTGQLNLSVPKGTLERLKTRARSLGINNVLRAGDFHESLPSVTSTPPVGRTGIGQEQDRAAANADARRSAANADAHRLADEIAGVQAAERGFSRRPLRSGFHNPQERGDPTTPR